MRHWFPDYHRQQICLLAAPYLQDVWRQQGAPGRSAVDRLQQCINEFVPCYQLTDHRLYDDCWLRDTLPLWFQQQTSHSARQWQAWQPKFNGWGGVQSEFAKDSKLAQQLFADHLEQQACWGEGGAFSHNGEWVLIGLQSLLQRNPDITRVQLEAQLTNALWPLKPIFLTSQLTADETQGHVDNLALFVDDKSVIYSHTNDPDHPDYHACQILRQQLEALPEPIRKIALPLPRPQYASATERAGLVQRDGSLKRTQQVPLLCSYVNLIALADAIIVPQFDLLEDSGALQCLQQAFPRHRIRQFSVREFILAGGGLHCLSYQLPQSLQPLVSAHVHRL